MYKYWEYYACSWVWNFLWVTLLWCRVGYIKLFLPHPYINLTDFFICLFCLWVSLLVSCVLFYLHNQTKLCKNITKLSEYVDIVLLSGFKCSETCLCACKLKVHENVHTPLDPHIPLMLNVIRSYWLAKYNSFMLTWQEMLSFRILKFLIIIHPIIIFSYFRALPSWNKKIHEIKSRIISRSTSMMVSDFSFFSKERLHKLQKGSKKAAYTVSHSVHANWHMHWPIQF